jgi:hypothetical protein
VNIIEALGGEDMLGFMINASGFSYGDDSVEFFVKDLKVRISEHDCILSSFKYHSIRITDRYGVLLKKHSAVYQTPLVRDLLEYELQLSLSF